MEMNKELNMKPKERNALCNFMINVLNCTFPNHGEYPFAELRDIEETEGDESDRFNKYPEYVQRAYWMKRDIEIIKGYQIY